jgi:hypothetical protein
MEAASKPASPITHAARAAIPSSRRMHANARSRHGNGIYSRPTTLNSRPNHRRRTSHTTSTITIIVPTKPKPNIAPPSGHIGHQGYPCRHDRPGFRLSSDQNQTITRIIEMGSVRSPTCCAWITAKLDITRKMGYFRIDEKPTGTRKDGAESRVETCIGLASIESCAEAD